MHKKLPGANNAQLEHRQAYNVTITLIYYQLLSEDLEEPDIYWIQRLYSCFDLVFCQLASRS